MCCLVHIPDRGADSGSIREKKADFLSSSSFSKRQPKQEYYLYCRSTKGGLLRCCQTKRQVAAPKDEEDMSDLSFSFLLLLAQTVYCLSCLHELIVVLRNQTGPSSTYSLISYRGPWPIVTNGDECCRCETSAPLSPGARGRQCGDCLRS